MNGEIEKQLRLTYEDQCKYLQAKYGLPERDYFANESCKTRVRTNSRSEEGLFLHHNAEIKIGNLGKTPIAKLAPFEYQKRENLSYCNYFEHLILHLKICLKYCKDYMWPFEFKDFLESLGFLWIAADMNTLYKNRGSEKKWRQDAFEAIEEYYEDYTTLLKGTMYILESHYVGVYNVSVVKGMNFDCEIPSIDRTNLMFRHNIHLDQGRHTIKVTKVNRWMDTVKLQIAEKEFSYKYSDLQTLFDYDEQIKKKRLELCVLGDGTVWPALKERLSLPYTNEDKMAARWLMNNSN